MLNLLHSFLICLVCPVLMATAFQANKPPTRVFALLDGIMNDMARPHTVQNDVDVVIVGSGISGSTAAFYMNRKGLNVMVAESQSESGGNFRSRKADGYLWEEGPNSFQPSPTILRFAKELGLINDLVLADSKLPRYVYWDSKLHALPSGPFDLPTFDLLSWTGKIRAGLGMMGLIAPKPKEEETIKEFVTRHLGEEVFERVIDPFVSGVYAGNPNKLSISAAMGKISALEGMGIGPGLLGGAMAKMSQSAAAKRAEAEKNADLPKVPTGSLGSFRDGLQSVTNRVGEILGDKLALSHKLVKVQKEGTQWLSTFETPHGIKHVRSKAVVVTCPGHVTGDLLSKASPATDTSSSEGSAGHADGRPPKGLVPEAAELSKVHYPAVAAVTLSYPDSAFKVPLKGFGHLIPRSMKIRTLGTIWASALFPGRAPAGHTMVRSFIGGSQDPGIQQLSEEQLVDQAHSDNQRILLKPNAPRPKVISAKMWQRAIPQYELGHQELLARVEAGVRKHPGLFLGGNYKTGVAIGDCIQFGIGICEEVDNYLKQ